MDFDRHSLVLEEGLPFHLLDQLQELTQLQHRAENLGAHLIALKQQITRDLRRIHSEDGDAAARPGGATILVAEDQRVARAIAQEVLEGLGYHVVFADGQLRDAATLPVVDAILLDVPFLSGAQLARVRLARRWSERIVVSTLLPVGPARAQLREAGVAGYVSKPLYPSEVGRCLREVLSAIAR